MISIQLKRKGKWHLRSTLEARAERILAMSGSRRCGGRRGNSENHSESPPPCRGSEIAMLLWGSARWLGLGANQLLHLVIRFSSIHPSGQQLMRSDLWIRQDYFIIIIVIFKPKNPINAHFALLDQTKPNQTSQLPGHINCNSKKYPLNSKS